jgi:copper resistance protein B
MKDMDMGATPTPPPEPAQPMKDMDMGAAPSPAPAPAPPMKDMDMSKPSVAGPPMGDMGTGSMQGGKAPPDARDPDAYAEGYKYSDMPGMEQADHIKIAKLLVDELEFLTGNEGNGVNWTAGGNYGGDQDKLWLRTQGQKIPGEILDPTTGAEALWWHASSPFWGTQFGLRQDIGPRAHTYVAFGTQGLAPRWFELQATGYVGDDGRLSARFKASYDMRFTNRLILVPSVEANLYSKTDVARGTGAGLGNIETGLRLRYEVQRKFAPYIGYVWERSFAGTAILRRAEGGAANEHRFVAGFRVWL